MISHFFTASFTLFYLVRLTGLEPARRGHQILNLARLPIPPQPHLGIKNGDPPGTRTRDTLIKSQVLCQLS